MKDTDDESLVDGADAGAEPATSTNIRTGYDGIFEFHKTVRRIEEERRMDLTGRTVHGVISQNWKLKFNGKHDRRRGLLAPASL